MKKKTVIITAITIAVLAICVWGAYALLDNIFPKASPITQLEMSMIESVHLYDDEKKEIVINDEKLHTLISYINGAVPTRTMSVNDYPGVEPYYVVEVQLAERFIRHMIYEDNGKAYIEIPYEGVYEIDKDAVGFLK